MYSQEQLIPPLSADEINRLRTAVFSEKIDFEQRVAIASSLTQWLDLQGQSRYARRLCLDFYSSITPFVDDIPLGEVSPLQSPFSEYASAIDQGNRRDTVARIKQYLGALSPGQNIAPCLSLLALKADSMSECYRVLYNDYLDKQISGYALYVMGIVAAREARFIEAEKFMLRAKNTLGSPVLDRWLIIDLAKVFIVNSKPAEAQAMIQDLLQKNPRDAQALSIMIFSHLKDKKELARQELSQLIDLLYPDPYLVAETAKLAIQLTELDTAASVLEQFQSKVEPNRDFYETFSFVRKNQGNDKEAKEWAEKAQQIRDARVSVTNIAALNDQLRGTFFSQSQRKKELDSLQGVDILSRVYYCLLEQDHQNALAILKANELSPYEQFIHAAIARRTGSLHEAVDTLARLKTDHPTFRPYQVLSMMADYAVRLGNIPQARGYYREIQDRFPRSYQAGVAQKVLSKPDALLKHPGGLSIPVSSRMSRFSQYAVPFVLSEVRGYWGDPTSFFTLTQLLQISPRKGVSFHRFLSILDSIPRLQVKPFAGTLPAVQECLQQKIPVLFCQDDFLTDSPTMTFLTLLVGYDPIREVVYAEGITPQEPHLLVETELLEGLCFAVYRSTVEPHWSDGMLQAIERGEELTRLHLDAMQMRTNPEYDSLAFINRQKDLLHETDVSALPLQLSFLRWTSKNKPFSMVQKDLQTLKKTCSSSAYYWFLKAVALSRQKHRQEAQEALQQALQKCPENPRYEIARIRMSESLQSIQEVIHQAELLRDQFPEDETVSFQLLLLYAKTGAKEKERVEKDRLKKLLHLDTIEIRSLDGETP